MVCGFRFSVFVGECSQRSMFSTQYSVLSTQYSVTLFFSFGNRIGRLGFRILGNDQFSKESHA